MPSISGCIHIPVGSNEAKEIILMSLIALYIGLYSPINTIEGELTVTLIALYIGLYSRKDASSAFIPFTLIALYIGLYSRLKKAQCT